MAKQSFNRRTRLLQKNRSRRTLPTISKKEVKERVQKGLSK
ncbi:Uncharacterised protein [Candidatus Tiddalikarchaeum anstoanum]|nr:Uncharacterised protein [Candidatus Tiddalikarchaeum anstoanum]